MIKPRLLPNMELSRAMMVPVSCSLALLLSLMPAPYANAGTPALAAAVPAVSTTTHIVAYREMPDVISADGVVEAVRQSSLAAQIAGQIVELKVRSGDNVKAGQVLMRIDPRVAEQAVAGSQSQLAEAQAGFANAARGYERSKQLFTQKFISKAGLDQAELDYQAAEARVGALRANAGQASTTKTFTIITAPYAGVVAATLVEVGDMATPGRPLITLFNPAHMRVLATLPQSSLSNVKLQMPVQIELSALKRSVTAKQATIVPLADNRTHTVKLRLELADTAVGGLLPGQFARAYFATGVTRRLVIPDGAVLRRSEVTAVYVYTAVQVDNKRASAQPQLRQIRLGDVSADGYVEVLSGLRAGEVIALDPVKTGLLPNNVSNSASHGER